MGKENGGSGKGKITTVKVGKPAFHFSLPTKGRSRNPGAEDTNVWSQRVIIFHSAILHIDNSQNSHIDQRCGRKIAGAERKKLESGKLKFLGVRKLKVQVSLFAF